MRIWQTVMTAAQLPSRARHRERLAKETPCFQRTRGTLHALPTRSMTDRSGGRFAVNGSCSSAGPRAAVAAVEDWCPHRGAPLSLGRVVEGKLVCGYHGLEMGCDGKPVAMPLQRVRGFPSIRTFPVVERYGFIWAWPGDPAKADPSKIHHLAWADNPEWAYGGGLYHVKCDYRLMIDNLMDLTHETYVHAGSIGQKEIDEAPPVTVTEGDEVVTSRLMESVMPPSFWQLALRGNQLADDVPCDRWQICRFSPPLTS